MRAVILAAGAGRRVHPLTRTQHKGLLEVGGRAILDRMLGELAELDLSVIQVVTGFMAAEVEAHLRAEHPCANLRFLHNERFAETNNVHSLRLALEHADAGDEVLVVECDMLLAPGLLARVAAPGRGNVALVDRFRPGMDGTVVHVRDGLITCLIPDPGVDAGKTFKTLNVYRFTAEFVATTLLPRLRASDLDVYYEAALAGLDLTEHRIEAEQVDGEAWMEVDDPADLASARFRFDPEARADILDRARGGHWAFGVTDFAFMRNAYFPAPAMLEGLRHELGDLLAEYGSAQSVVNEKLAWWLGCEPAHVEALHGATQAYPIVRELWAGRRIAIPDPTFGEYGRMFPDAHTYADRPGVEPAALERLAAEVDVLVAVNPNNPTGTTLDSAELHALAARHPRMTLLVDESFIDFSDQPSIRSLLDRRPLSNVVVLASLSKSLGVPGLRLGYLYGHDRALLHSVADRLPIWNLSSIAERFLELLLKFRSEFAASLVRTSADRAEQQAALSAVAGIVRVHPSGGNFLLVELDGDAGHARELRRRLLAECAIEVKDVSGRFPDGVGRLRVGLRGPDENRRLVQEFKRTGRLAPR